MSETIQLVAAAMGGGLTSLAPVAVVWLRSRSARQEAVDKRTGAREDAHDARDTARDDRVETLEGQADALRAELEGLIRRSAEECDAKVRAQIAVSEASCGELLRASEERSTARVVAAEARADLLVERLTKALTRAGALSADSTGVHEVETAIREGRQSRSTPRSWPAAPDESGGER